MGALSIVASVALAGAVGGAPAASAATDAAPATASDAAGTPTTAALPAGVSGAGTPSLRSVDDAGYQADLGGSPSKEVSTALIVPTVTCAAQGESGIYPTAEVLDGGRTGAVGVGIAIVCDGGAVSYESADAYAGAANKVLAVAPGDQVQITVEVGGGTESATIDDVTAATTTSATGPVGQHAPVYALVGLAPIFEGHHPLATPDFGGVSFSGASVDGSPLARAKGLVKLTRSNRKHVDIWTGSLTGHGGAFNVTQLP